MWTGRSNDAVFLPPPGEGARTAYTEHRGRTPTHLRVRALIGVQPVPREVGPRVCVNVSGSVTLTGPRARLSFSRQGGGKAGGAAPPVVTELPLLPPGATLQVGNRMVCSRRHAAPYLWISFCDALRGTLAGAMGLGRPLADEVRIEPVFEVPALATTWLSAVGAGRGVPELQLTGEVVVPDGIVMQVVMSTTGRPSGEPDATEVASVEIVRPGTVIEFEPRTVAPKVSGRPFVTMQLQDWDGNATGVESAVGWLTRW